VFALILILSIMTGFLEESRRAVRGSLSDILIQPESRYGSARPAAPEPFLAVVRRNDKVAAATPQLFWAGIIARRGSATERALSSPSAIDLGVQLVGIDVRTPARLLWPALRVHAATLGGVCPVPRIQDEFDATNLLAALAAAGPGEERFGVENPLLPFLPPAGYVPPGRRRAAVVVGEQLARNFGLGRGSEIQIQTIVRDPVTDEYVGNNRDFVVAGTFRSRENETDLERVYLERSELTDFLGGSQQFSQILVRLHDYDQEGALAREELERSLVEADLLDDEAWPQVLTWEDFRGNLLGAIENERVLMAIMLSLVLIVAGFTVFAILSMMVTEKRRDIGILGALGATPRGILHLFLMIAFWDALLGAVLGGAAGAWAAIEIDAVERWLSSTFGWQIFNRDVYIFDYIPSIVQPLWVATIVLGAFVCALLFAAIPAWRAASLHPLEALHYE
jgi:ABC-type lipoprotein release transport system permease subunit